MVYDVGDYPDPLPNNGLIATFGMYQEFLPSGYIDGNPNYFSEAVSVASQHGLIYVLDRKRKCVDEFTLQPNIHKLTLRNSYRLGATSDLGLYP